MFLLGPEPRRIHYQRNINNARKNRGIFSFMPFNHKRLYPLILMLTRPIRHLQEKHQYKNALKEEFCMESPLLNLKLLERGTTIDQNSNTVPQAQIAIATTATVSEQPKKKRGRPKKEQSDDKPESNTCSLPLCQTSEPYEDTYEDTNDMLKVSIAQLDILAGDVKGEIDNIRGSKTLKGKYKYISDLCATASSLVSSKISAIKELNSVKTKCHELEIRRLKDVKSAMANQQDDDKYIADLYNAYINTPIGSTPHPALQYTSANVAGNMGALMGGTAVAGQNEEQNFNNYMNNLTPEQNRMILGDNPNIETVVVYDPNTGDKMFDVIDTSTGTPVQNYPRPDRGLLDDTVIDFSTGIASNTNIGQSWKVVVVGNPL